MSYFGKKSQIQGTSSPWTKSPRRRSGGFWPVCGVAARLNTLVFGASLLLAAGPNPLRTARSDFVHGLPVPSVRISAMFGRALPAGAPRHGGTWLLF